MLSTVLVIVAVWFFGSIPIALLLGRMLSKLSRTPEPKAALQPTVAQPVAARNAHERDIARA